MITISEWISNGLVYISKLVPADDLQTDVFTQAHDGVHWYLELGVDFLSEEKVSAWTYGLCGMTYPLHSEYHQMGVEDRSLLPIELVNWLLGTL